MPIRGGCLTDCQTAPQTHGVWLWFKLGHQGRSLLAVLSQYKEINICKCYWYMSRQWHGVRLDLIIIKYFIEILDRLIFRKKQTIFQSFSVFLHFLFQTTLNFSSCSFSFILHWVGFLCNSNTELVTWAHVTFPIDRHFCGLFQWLVPLILYFSSTASSICLYLALPPIPGCIRGLYKVIEYKLSCWRR